MFDPNIEVIKQAVKRDVNARLAKNFVTFFVTSSINLIIQEHDCQVLFIV